MHIDDAKISPPMAFLALRHTWARRTQAGICPLLRLFMLSDPDSLVVIGRIEFGVIGAPGCGLEDTVDLAQAGGRKA